MKSTMLVNLERCLGCWTCSMACKVGNGLADDDYRVAVRTLGSGKGIDRPAGVFPELTMSWQPVFATSCVWCAGRSEDIPGETYCTYNCPTEALCYGDGDDPSSAVSKEINRLREAGYQFFSLPSWEKAKSGVLYASKK